MGKARFGPTARKNAVSNPPQALTQKSTHVAIARSRPANNQRQPAARDRQALSSQLRGRMWMSRVRIYDLSKELNLENRDILDICEQLNISVKSHSSTITESQAEQIRASAAQGAAARSANGGGPRRPRARRPERPTAAAAPPAKKPRPQPQILEVRSRKRGEGEDAESGSPVATPPKSPSGKPQPLAPKKPQLQAPPKRPGSSPPLTAAPDEEDSKHEETPPELEPVTAQNVETPEIAPQLPQVPEVAPEPPEPPEPPEALHLQPPAETPEVAQSPASDEIDEIDEIGDREAAPELEVKLKGPPTRPKPPAPAAKPAAPKKEKPKKGGEPPRKGEDAPVARQGDSAERPQRDRSEIPNGKPKPAPAKTSRPSADKPEKGSKPEKGKVAASGVTGKDEEEKPKLFKPQRPGKPKSAPAVEEEEPETDELAPEVTEDATETAEDDDSLLEKPKRQPLKLKRPSAAPKKKEWEEEEESAEAKAKAAKAAAKAKRRPKPIAEEDDEEMAIEGTLEIEDLDLEEEEEELPEEETAGTNALSLERPPKPDSMKAAKKAPAAKPKPKKATAKTGSRDRSDRRRQVEETPQRPETLTIAEGMTVQELAEKLVVPETEIVKKLFFKGMAVNITQSLDLETVRQIAQDYEVTIETPEETAAATKVTEMLDMEDLENLQLRPPVVTIMGHVDHGKTSLLDAIRSAKVAQGEAGGITQHIGAYHVDLQTEGESKQIVFLDTPGHEAFTAMRARGARVTDISVLVVAADDGVQPQTKEAISHARAAGVPLVVAINKIDKEGANPDRVMQELTEQGLVPEDWGGDTIMVPVSALQRQNLDTLLEMILLVSEIEELSANPNRPARGTVIEANLDRARGPVATLLVQNGTLRVGDAIVAGAVFGKVRAAIDDRGHRVEAAGPSFPVEVLGLDSVPNAGDEFEVYPDEREARALAQQRAAEERTKRLQQRRVTLSSLSAQAQEGALKELNLILKADVQGSVEAIVGSLKQLPQNEVQIRPLLAAPGEITETDVDLAAASGAVIVGFNTTLASGAKMAADLEGVDVREYDVIYKLLDDIQGAMEGLLDPEEVEEPLGEVEVRAVFPVGRGTVAGCYVLSGKVIRNRNLRVRRNGQVVFQGALDSLKRLKEDAREVNAGYECGIGSSKFNDWKEGDIIEVYQMVMKRRTLSLT